MIRYGPHFSITIYRLSTSDSSRFTLAFTKRHISGMRHSTQIVRSYHTPDADGGQENVPSSRDHLRSRSLSGASAFSARHCFPTSWVKRIGELLGFEYTTIRYSLRYMAAGNMDRDSMFLSPHPALSMFPHKFTFPQTPLRLLIGPDNISESLRNLCTDHAHNSSVFQINHLGRTASADLWAIQRKTAPPQAIIDYLSS